MGDALGTLAANNPLVILLEDIHWADPSSIDLLRHLCQRVGTQRLLVIGTFRPEDVERSGHPLKSYKLEMQSHKLCEEIALGSLSYEHVASYLDLRFSPNDFPRELPALIQRKTEGHPLFATSLVQFLSERGDIAKANEHWTLMRPISEMDLEMPESVRSMIRKKIEALAEQDRRALQYASIEGEEFTSTVLARLLGMDELDLEEQLDRLDKITRLIETREEEELPDGALKFVDALVSTSDPPHFLWAAVHFVLNVKPARLHGERLRTEVQVHSRRPARSRREFGRRRGNTSVTDQSVNEEEDAPFPQVYGEASGMGPSNFDHNPKRSGSRSRADRLLD